MQGSDTPLRSVLSRRGALKLGVGIGIGMVVVAGASGAWLLRSTPAAPGLHTLSVDEAYFPAGNALGVSAADVDIVSAVDTYLGRLLPREQRLSRALFVVLEQWPRVSFSSSRGFSQLSVPERIEVLRAWEDSEIPQRNLLATVLRSLVGMPYFEDARVLSAMGHRFGCLPVLPA